MEMLDKQIRRLGGQQEAFINSGELSTLLKKELKSILTKEQFDKWETNMQNKNRNKSRSKKHK